MIERRKTVSPLLYWAEQREFIRLRKAAGLPPPWTGDPILQKYRFCNVRRAHDRVSQWIIEWVLNYVHDFDDLHVFVQWVALCRWINWPPTLGMIIDDSHLVTYDKIDLQGIGDLIEEIKSEGDKAYTGAYMVRAPSKKKYPGMSKGKFVSEVVVGALSPRPVWEQLSGALLSKTCFKVWDVLVSLPNWGSFMAGQVMADLTYTDLLGGAYDLNTWAPKGPGSTRGFNRMLGRPLKTKIDDIEWSERLQEWRQQVVNVTGLVDMTLMDLQNCLCEVDKYLRVKNGEGRPRSTYKPETAY